MINKDLFKTIILEPLPNVKLVPRETKISKVNKIFTVIGPRRSGKTYFLFEILNNILVKSDKNRILYINFEDDRLINLETSDLQMLLDAFYELYPNNKSKKCYFFFDEIQNVPDWPKFIRRIYDKENCEIYISGSSAKLLSKEIATELRGRTWDYYMYPFSFREYLLAKNYELDSNSIFSEKKYAITNELKNYLLTGSFPEVINLESFERSKILQNYLDVVILRDVIERYNISSVDLVKEFILFLLNNYSRYYSTNNFYNFLKSLGRKVSKDSIYYLQDCIENTMYFYFIQQYSKSEKVRSANPKKVYVVDIGLANSFSLNLNSDLSWKYENVVFLELLRRDYQIYYFKDKFECDFIVVDIRGNILPIQVTIDPNKENELNGLLNAMENLNVNEGIIITQDVDKTEKINKKIIKYIPLWKWLLMK